MKSNFFWSFFLQPLGCYSGRDGVGTAGLSTCGPIYVAAWLIPYLSGYKYVDDFKVLCSMDLLGSVSTRFLQITSYRKIWGREGGERRWSRRKQSFETGLLNLSENRKSRGDLSPSQYTWEGWLPLKDVYGENAMKPRPITMGTITTHNKEKCVCLWDCEGVHPLWGCNSPPVQGRSQGQTRAATGKLPRALRCSENFPLTSAEDKWRSWIGWLLWRSLHFSPYSDQIGKKQRHGGNPQRTIKWSRKLSTVCTKGESGDRSLFFFSVRCL